MSLYEINVVCKCISGDGAAGGAPAPQRMDPNDFSLRTLGFLLPLNVLVAAGSVRFSLSVQDRDLQLFGFQPPQRFSAQLQVWMTDN